MKLSREGGTVREDVTISYRGASYEIGRGPGCYGIWLTGAPRSQPLERWPATPEGWYGAWARFAGIEVPGTITPVGPGAAPARPGIVPARQGVVLARPGVVLARPGVVLAGPGVPAGGGTPAAIAAALLGAGVACGIAGLFPGYLAGASLAGDPADLVPHLIYLAAWTVSAVLVLLGGGRLRAGALLGTGASIVTFGLFFADAGQAMAGGAHLAGAGLALSLIGWLACAAGSAMALRPAVFGPIAWRPAAGGRRAAGALVKPDGDEIGFVLALGLAGLGAAAAFAPSWDSYILRTAAGVLQSVTAGNAFANPAPVIGGNVAVMVAVVAVAVLAGLWRPAWQGAALLAGAIVPLAAQAISALVGLGEATSPAEFGISPSQASQAGLTISSGVTPAFWIYCAFVVVLIALCARMLIPPRAAQRPAPAPANGQLTQSGTAS